MSDVLVFSTGLMPLPISLSILNCMAPKKEKQEGGKYRELKLLYQIMNKKATKLDSLLVKHFWNEG